MRTRSKYLRRVSACLLIAGAMPPVLSHADEVSLCFAAKRANGNLVQAGLKLTDTGEISSWARLSLASDVAPAGIEFAGAEASLTVTPTSRDLVAAWSLSIPRIMRNGEAGLLNGANLKMHVGGKVLWEGYVQHEEPRSETEWNWNREVKDKVYLEGNSVEAPIFLQWLGGEVEGDLTLDFSEVNAPNNSLRMVYTHGDFLAALDLAKSEIQSLKAAHKEGACEASPG